MPTAKLGQLSHNAVSDIQQKHWDVDMKIRDHLSLLSLDHKMKLLAKIPGVIDEIKAGEKQDNVNADFVTG